MDPHTAYAIASTFAAVSGWILAARFAFQLSNARKEISKMDGDGDGKVGGYWKR